MLLIAVQLATPVIILVFLSDFSFGIISRVAPQVNVFDLQGEMIGAGYYSRLIERDAKFELWYAEVMRRKGDRVILPPHVDPLQEQTSIVVKGKRKASRGKIYKRSDIKKAIVTIKEGQSIELFKGA